MIDLFAGLVTVAFAAGLAMMWRRDQRNAATRRDHVFDACAAMFESPRIERRRNAWPVLRGRWSGSEVELRLESEALAVRKLPSLWLSVTLRGPTRCPGTVEMMMRPLGVELWSRVDDLPLRHAPLSSWPREMQIRADDEAVLALLDRMEPAAILLTDPRGKTVTVAPSFILAVWQAAQGARSEYLLMRQPAFGNLAVEPATVRAILDAIMAIREAL